MLKPFFKPFFGSSLPTRIGKIIGKSNERVMLSGVDGPDGIRKKFRRNPDGSVTMLKTRAGMPQFKTSKSITPPDLIITISSANAGIPAADPNTAYLTHTVMLSASFANDRTYSFSYIDDSAYSLDYEILPIDTFSDGVYGSGYPAPGSTPRAITVPARASSFTISVTVECVPFTAPSVRYRIFVGGSFGSGTVEAI